MQNCENYNHIYIQNVAWGDMDAFGHINNVIYYRYIENARISYLDQLDIFNYPIYVVVAFNSCKYLSPVLYPDILEIRVKISELRTSGFRMVYIIWSRQQQKIVAEAEAILVCVNKDNGIKIPLPNAIREKIIAIEIDSHNDL
ncbi:MULTISPECIES: thioesterase family protein [unclassified Acinetobacter]|uniref:acyl-CoA thioesterase n=1 Tax=unclassified Acinetobacter TaxID=196816 RepID=UPI002934D3BF|nr:MULTISPECIES: thioesterase family protein [unclassified Acinetobacter]WOE30647.1 thioesterase family protein [Acinetobacter sp. SAAs470]WOE38839.1 thioesterase family protein [Acinetobacter sp. SAAs474]